MYEFLTLDVSDRIAVVTLNRPDKLNALNEGLIRELGDCTDALLDRDDVGAIIVTGAGRAFAAGADLSELAGLSAVDAQKVARTGQRVFRALETSLKPTIAAVNGFALGGGCELAMSCHVRIVADTAKLGQPEVKLGLAPGYGGTQRLARLVGRGRAMQLLLTGDPVDAAEAHRTGLANAVVPGAELLATARKMASTMLANAPLALAACIEAVDIGLEHGLDAGLAYEASAFGVLFATSDAREGIQAFLDRKPAKFTGT